MKILSLDLSSKSTGYAIKENGKLLKYGCITQSASKNYIERIYNIVNEIITIIKENDIKHIWAEEVRFGDQNIHTFKTLMYLQSHLVCEAHFVNPEIEFNFFQPSEHRAAVGIKTGRGVTRDMCKAAAIAYVKNKYAMDVNDDIADAITIADAAERHGLPTPTTTKRPSAKISFDEKGAF